MYRIAMTVSTISAILVCSFCLGTSDLKGVPIDDSVSASLRGGACTGYTAINNCAPPKTTCATQCYSSGGGNMDQNASNLTDVCKSAISSTSCARKFENVAPCGSGTGGGTGN